MSVQFNLLPDVKMDYLKAQRSRNTIVSAAVLISVVSFVIFLITFFSVSVIQHGQQKKLDGDIKTASTKLSSLKGLDQVLTVQSQLGTLVQLHTSKHISSRIFTYLPQVSPSNVQIGRLSLDMSANTMQIDGTAPSQLAVNTFIDTLKFTTYTTPGSSAPKSAFPSVVLTSFSVGSGTSNYSLTVGFDPVLFANNITDANGKKAAPTLNVPKQTTTRSVLEDPTQLFNGQFSQPGSTGGGGQ
jgi:Tfp pilus assembly protein PilN